MTAARERVICDLRERIASLETSTAKKPVGCHLACRIWMRFCLAAALLMARFTNLPVVDRAPSMVRPLLFLQPA